jgi:uncharacterized protein
MQWIRDRFPEARISAPDENYLRIHHPMPGLSGDAAGRAPSLPPGALLFDLETLGFLGHPVFLIGLMRQRPAEGAWEVLQLLARDYTEEEAILRAFGAEAEQAARWVSFNGKSFDLPFLQRRAAFHHLTLPAPRDHLDLLHLARRAYRGVLPNCRLQTLEDRVLRRARFDDLPGAEVPKTYHEFVRTGDPGRMAGVLEHNRHDLVTLAELLVHLECGEDLEAS